MIFNENSYERRYDSHIIARKNVTMIVMTEKSDSIGSVEVIRNYEEEYFWEVKGSI